MALGFTIFVTVIFFAGKRSAPPCLHNERYMPHLVVKGGCEDLGVCFIDGPDCRFDRTVNAAALPMYEGVGYDQLTPNTPFFIMEGGRVVGEGVVSEIFAHQPLK